MKATGIIEIEKDLFIENPELELSSAYVEAIFTDENGFKQSRLMKVDLNSVILESAIESNEILKQFS